MPKSSKPTLRVVKGGYLSVSDAQKHIRQSAKISGGIALTEHCVMRMEERDVSPKQLQRALWKGQIVGHPNYNTKEASWVCKVRYHGSERNLTVICSPMKDRLVITAITVY